MDSTLREFLRQGNTVISNLVLKNYKKLGMTDTEFILYLQLNSYLQKGETFPELENIAKSLQISVNDVYTQLHNLIEKKILKIETIVNQQGQKTDSYSFDFLYQKLDSLIDEEKKELLIKIKDGDEEARQTFINGNLRLVLSVIQRFYGRGENADDLFQVGCVGLIKAIDNFDINQDVQFSTYRSTYDNRRNKKIFKR